MSTISKTPDDKMHRYLQRIQKLVGHRAKSPILIKSRTKSPINIKTSRIDSYLKQEMLIKSVISVWDHHQRRTKILFFENLIKSSQVKQKKRRESCYSQQNHNHKRIFKKQNDQPLAVRFIVKVLQKSVYSIVVNIFQSIKTYQPQIQQKQPQQNVKKPFIHRRTYSEIYAESVSKYISKSPTPSQHFEYKTPSVQKKQSLVNLKRVQTTLIVSILKKLSLKSSQSTFSELKSLYCTSLTEEINQASRYLAKIEHKFTALKIQQEKTNQQLRVANKTILEQQKLHQITFQEKQKLRQESLSNKENQQNNEIIEIQRVLHQTGGIFSIYEILNRKNVFNQAFAFHKINSIKIISISKQAKCITLAQTLKTLQKSRKVEFFIKLSQKIHEIKIYEQSRISLMKTESRQAFVQRPHIPPQATHQTVIIQSMQSSKHSHSSQKSNASNFDLFSKKINKAFQLKKTLTEIYSLGFQKIDQASFVYMAISNPLNKVLKKSLTQSFRKILFFSFYKSQERQKPLDLNQTSTIVQPQIIDKNYEKMTAMLKKIERKIMFLKIQAYSVLKLNSELKKVYKIPDQFVISEVQLRKQIKDFLQQRNKMHQKTFDTWQKTKEMLQEVTHSQSRSSLNSRVKI